MKIGIGFDQDAGTGWQTAGAGETEGVHGTAMLTQQIVQHSEVRTGLSAYYGAVGHQSQLPGVTRALQGRCLLTSIYAIDMASGTYAADLWIWSVGTSPTRDPLATMEFVASDKITRRMESAVRRGDLYWRQARIVNLRQSWDLRQFPFDKQVLVLTVEEGINDVTRVTYDVDTDDTGYQPDASPQGWRIISQQVTTETTHYATGFGDPAGGKGSDYAKLQVVITLQRASVATFLNLAAPLYAGFLLCLPSAFCCIRMAEQSLNRASHLLGSALFAVSCHMQAVSSVLGSEHQLTIVDCLNIAVLVYIVFGAIVAVTAGIRYNKGRPISVRLEYFCGAAIAVSFAVINIFLLSHAI